MMSRTHAFDRCNWNTAEVDPIPFTQGVMGIALAGFGDRFSGMSRELFARVFRTSHD